MIGELIAKCRSLAHAIFARASMERRMEEELLSHIAVYAEDLERRGVPKTEAERMARTEFAGLEGLKEQCREARGLRIFDELAQDLRYAARGFRKNPGFAAVATLTLALGIGANTALFSAVKSWVLEPVPFPNPARLVTIWSFDTKRGQNLGLTAADYYDWCAHAPVFENIAAWNDGYRFAVTGEGDPDLVRGARVAYNFFQTLGARPALGRDFTPDDDRPGADPVAVITDSFWRSRFGASPTAIGKSVKLDEKPVTIVGVLGPEFQFALAGRVQIWRPLALTASERQVRNSGLFNVTARLKPDVTVARARAVMNTVTQNLERAYPDANKNRGAVLRPLAEEIGLDYANELLAVFGIVGCVLLIACINVANLMVARATGRKREFAVRLALGAGRGRLVRQVLTENIFLFVAGAALGLIVAVEGAHWLSKLLSYDIRGYIPNFGEARVDLAVCGYALAVSIVTGLLFGFAPALETARLDVNHRLKETARSSSSGAGGGRLKNCLVVFETALALAVLIAAGLLGNSLVRIFRVNAGFDPRHLGLVRLELSEVKYKDPHRADAFLAEVLDRIRAIPGVEQAAASPEVPFGDYYMNVIYALPGESSSQSERKLAQAAAVTPAYFATLGIPVVRGRAFDERDCEDSLPVIVVNETMAKRYWPGADPIGQHVLTGNARKEWTVIGVAGDVKRGELTEKPMPQMYRPLPQARALNLVVAVRTAGDPLVMGSLIRSAIWTLDRNQPVSSMETMDAHIREQHAATVYVTQVTALFGFVALCLAAIGIYGVTSYSVAARRQEIGIRIALGASANSVIGMILRRAMLLAAMGVLIGAAGSLALTRLLSSLLFNVRSTDVATFAAVSGLLAATALAASYIPARRAAVADPVKTLHHE